MSMTALLLALAASFDDGSLITNPSWAQHPMPAYPEAAFAQGIRSGDVVLNCGVKDGTLTDCRVASETPGGFGDAAMAAARHARLSETTVAKAPKDARVQFTVRFRVQD